MTAAVILACPNLKCDNRFFKEDGCNKMKCPRCLSQSCYLVQIEDYEQFCSTPHCNHKTCGKCVLWTKTKEDDTLACREAGRLALEKAGTTAAEVGLLLSLSQKKEDPTTKPKANQARQPLGLGEAARERLQRGEMRRLGEAAIRQLGFL
jgi:hypothetical protein